MKKKDALTQLATHTLPKRSRRVFLGSSVAAFGTAMASPRFLVPSLQAQGADPSEPHFFLTLFIPGGLDATYGFDARPLSMTAAELLQNYDGRDPLPFNGNNGGTCLRSPVANALMPFMDRFSLLNGVVMTPDFDGHEDNQSFLLTGNPLGGTTFFEALGAAGTPCPVSAMLLGSNLVADSRMSTRGALRINKLALQEMAENSRSIKELYQNEALIANVRKRFALRPQEFGSYAKTKHLMDKSIEGMPPLVSGMAELSLPEGDDESPLGTIQTILGTFQSGICRAGMYVFDTDMSENQNLDAHDFEGAKNQPRIIGEIFDELRTVLSYLRDTAFNDHQSFFDVTTVMIASEFSRTTRQGNFAMSGTDHNALTNSILLGGKGIKAGQIIGASDFASESEHNKLSGAHMQLDPRQVKFMGRPFDFTTGRPRLDLPEAFKATDYLTANSVVNTLMDLFKVDKEHWRKIERSENSYPLIPNLI